MLYYIWDILHVVLSEKKYLIFIWVWSLHITNIITKITCLQYKVISTNIFLKVKNSEINGSISSYMFKYSAGPQEIGR